MRKYQFIDWWPEWQGFGFTRLDPARTDMAFVYEWYLWAGWWVVRKWCSQERRERMMAEDRPGDQLCECDQCGAIYLAE